MSRWVRLHITVEGHAERVFIEQAVAPHLARFAIDARARIVKTNRKLGARGGVVDFEKVRADLVALLKEDRSDDARFTTMFDLYAIPDEFPGWATARQQRSPVDRATELERGLDVAMRDRRFFAHLQLHEFEALLFADDLNRLEARLPGHRAGFKELRSNVGALAPEEIDDGRETAPSKRIIKHIPLYEKVKVLHGAPAAALIGLETLMRRCPHFGAWVRRLEALGTRATEIE
jgi:hypothetical protein